VTQAEQHRFDSLISSTIDSQTRQGIWKAVDEILDHGPLADLGKAGATGLALGYVQSGKTTSITALIAAAADAGYTIIIALLGSTNILLDQNTNRIEDAIVNGRTDYNWITIRNAKGAKSAKEIAQWLSRDRVVLLPLLKHAGRIGQLADALKGTETATKPVLIVDDEADQASLNTAVNEAALSKTYDALQSLRGALPNHLYVQYTATPYAPLLLDIDDQLRPEFVTLLHPGPGYTGGREFFVDSAAQVIRPIPSADEQAAKSLPLRLHGSLEDALANFLIGAAMLLADPEPAAPISMLIHSTQKNDVQARYHFLVERQLRAWRNQLAELTDFADLPHKFRDEYNHLISVGAVPVEPERLFKQLKRATSEATVWLVNSESSLKSIQWNVTPVHILVGGNKLDRGFTVEGLTVTYMNRPTSTQIDTLEQRARAFGYRRKLLPYCQFFSTPKTLKYLREIVFTEYDLRANLRDTLDSGKSLHDWATEIGLLLPQGTKPTRPAVIGALQAFNQRGAGWHSMRRPSIEPADVAANARLIKDLGLLDAPRVDYGRLSFPTLNIPVEEVISRLLDPWVLTSYSPGWRPGEIVDHLRRHCGPDSSIPVALMDDQAGGARVRAWDELGFVNLFQGRDTQHAPGVPFYPGDREVPNDLTSEVVALQVHFVQRRGTTDDSLFALAIKLGDRQIVRKADPHG